MEFKLFQFNFKAMGCANEIQLYARDGQIAQAIADHLINDVNQVEQKYSRYRDASIISMINRNAGKNAVEVDEETAALLDYAETCFQSSDGLFDITSGILRRAWDFKQSKLPGQSAIDELLPLIGWDKVEWKKPFFKLSRVGMEIDFGGIGKEYAVDRAAGLLQKSAVQHGLINLGGDIRIIGSQPNGRPWSIGIVHPRKPDSVIASLSLSSAALATSGDYERFFELDGKRYCHILNPKTGRPSEGFQSVTVISASCLVSGTAATIAMLKGEIEGTKFLKDLGQVYFFIDSKGKAHHSDSLKFS